MRNARNTHPARTARHRITASTTSCLTLLYENGDGDIIVRSRSCAGTFGTVRTFSGNTAC